MTMANVLAPTLCQAAHGTTHSVLTVTQGVNTTSTLHTRTQRPKPTLQCQWPDVKLPRG